MKRITKLALLVLVLALLGTIFAISAFAEGEPVGETVTSAEEPTTATEGAATDGEPASNVVYVNFFNKAYGAEDASVVKTIEVLPEQTFAYDGASLDYNAVDISVGGNFYTVSGYQLYVVEGETETLVGDLAPLSEAYASKTVNVYPVFDVTPVAYAIAVDGVITPYKAEDNIVTAISAAKSHNTKVVLYRDIAISTAIARATYKLEFDLNGHVISSSTILFEIKNSATLNLYSSKKDGAVYCSSYITRPMSGTSKVYIGFCDKNGNGEIDADEKDYKGNLALYGTTIVQLYAGKVDAKLYGTSIYAVRSGSQDVFYFSHTSSNPANTKRTLLVDSCEVYSAGQAAGNSVVRFGGNMNDSAVFKDSTFVALGNETPSFARVVSAAAGKYSVTLEGCKVYAYHVAGIAETDTETSVTFNIKAGTQLSNYEVNAYTNFVDENGDEAVIARIPGETTTTRTYKAAYGDESQTVEKTVKNGYAVVTADNAQEITWVKIVNGVETVRETEYWRADIDKAELPCDYFDIREGYTIADTFKLETAGVWAENVFTYTETGSVIGMMANVVLDTSIITNIYIPKSVANIVAIQGETVTIDGAEYYLISIENAPKDAYKNALVAFTVSETTGDEENGFTTVSFEVAFEYSIVDYLETLLASTRDTDYINDAKALAPYVAKYIVEAAEKLNAEYDAENANIVRLAALVGDTDITFTPEAEKVKDPVNTYGVTAAYLSLDSMVGFVFTVNDNVTAVTITIGETTYEATIETAKDGVTKYVFFGNVAAYDFAKEITVNVTYNVTETVGEEPTTTSANGSFVYDLYTYVASMITQDEDEGTGFAAAAYAYAKAAEAFNAKGYDIELA